MASFELDSMVVDAVMPDLIGHDRRPAAFAVYLALLRRCGGAGVGAGLGGFAVRISHQGLADATGLSRSAVQAALGHLNRRQLVATTRSKPTAVPLHRVMRPWTRLRRG